jgi:hypothetical protein
MVKNMQNKMAPPPLMEGGAEFEEVIGYLIRD